MDKTTRMSILFDFYGLLLPVKQEQIFRMYYDENLSLAEIGDEMGMTKQGAHDALKKAENSLEEFEDKLNLEAGSRKNEIILARVSDTVDKLLKDSESSGIREDIKKIEEDLNRLTV